MTPFLEMNAINASSSMSALRDGNSRNSFGSYTNNGLGTWVEHEHQHSCNFDFQGLIDLEVELSGLPTCSDFFSRAEFR